MDPTNSRGRFGRRTPTCPVLGRSAEDSAERSTHLVPCLGQECPRWRRAFSRLGWRSPSVAGGREPAVQIEGSADQRKVRERLGEVAEVLRLGAQLLAVQPEMVGVAEHLLE